MKLYRVQVKRDQDVIRTAYFTEAHDAIAYFHHARLSEGVSAIVDVIRP